MKPAAYLDAVKAELNLSSDYELAKALELSNAYIPGMRDGSRKIRNDLAFKIAITLKLDPAMVIARSRRTTGEERETTGVLAVFSLACSLRSGGDRLHAGVDSFRYLWERSRRAWWLF